MEDLNRLASNLMIFAELKQSVNTRDNESASISGQLMAKLSAIAAAQTKMKAYIAAQKNLDQLIAADPLLIDYKYLLTTIREDSKYLLSEREEEIMARLSISGADAWSELQNVLTSSVPVAYNGETTNLSAIRNLPDDPDPAVRKSAYEAELGCYDRIADSVAYSLNSIKLQVINECELRGFASPLEKTVHDAAMKMETLDALMSAIDEELPAFHRYLRVKARALGHEGGLPWYDLFGARWARSGKKYTVDEARDYLRRSCSPGYFDKSLHDMVERALKEDWIDFIRARANPAARSARRCPARRRACILTEFRRQLQRHRERGQHEPGVTPSTARISPRTASLNMDYCMPVAETASTFNENVVMNAAISAAQSRAEKIALIEGQLSDACRDHLRYLRAHPVRERRVRRAQGEVHALRTICAP